MVSCWFDISRCIKLRVFVKMLRFKTIIAYYITSVYRMYTRTVPLEHYLPIKKVAEHISFCPRLLFNLVQVGCVYQDMYHPGEDFNPGKFLFEFEMKRPYDESITLTIARMISFITKASPKRNLDDDEYASYMFSLWTRHESINPMLVNYTMHKSFMGRINADYMPTILYDNVFLGNKCILNMQETEIMASVYVFSSRLSHEQVSEVRIVNAIRKLYKLFPHKLHSYMPNILLEMPC